MYKMTVTYKSGVYHYGKLTPANVRYNIEKILSGDWNCLSMTIEKDENGNEEIKKEIAGLKEKISKLEKTLGL